MDENAYEVSSHLKHELSVAMNDLQMLLFSWEWVGKGFQIFRLVFPNFRLQGCSDFLHKHVDLLYNAASLTDFIFLKMTWQHSRAHHVCVENSDSLYHLISLKKIYLYCWHFELHKLCFSTKNFPRRMDFQESHAW